MQRLRQLHLWLGVLFSPLIIFFAFTGILQTFHWHERQKSGSYLPPAWLIKLATIHKDQSFTRNPGGPSPLPMKWVVAVMGVGLIFTSALGIYMAFKYHRDQRLVWALIVAGIVLPVLMLFV